MGAALVQRCLGGYVSNIPQDGLQSMADFHGEQMVSPLASRWTDSCSRSPCVAGLRPDISWNRLFARLHFLCPLPSLGLLLTASSQITRTRILVSAAFREPPLTPEREDSGPQFYSPENEGVESIFTDGSNSGIRSLIPRVFPSTWQPDPPLYTSYALFFTYISKGSSMEEQLSTYLLS